MEKVCRSCEGSVESGGSVCCRAVEPRHRLNVEFLRKCLTEGNFVDRNRAHFRDKCLHYSEVCRALGIK